MCRLAPTSGRYFSRTWRRRAGNRADNYGSTEQFCYNKLNRLINYAAGGSICLTGATGLLKSAAYDDLGNITNKSDLADGSGGTGNLHLPQPRQSLAACGQVDQRHRQRDSKDLFILAALGLRFHRHGSMSIRLTALLVPRKTGARLHRSARRTSWSPANSDLQSIARKTAWRIDILRAVRLRRHHRDPQ